MANVPKMEAVSRGPAGPGDSPRPQGERELVRRAQAGDHAAFELLVRAHQRRLYAVVSAILRRREDVEDVAQQVFVKAYFSLGKFDQRSALGTWLYKIAVNECWDYLRRKRVRPLLYEADLSEEQARQVEAAEPAALGIGPLPSPARRAEQRQLVQRLLAEVGEQDRLMLVLKEAEGFSVEEIAEILDLNVNTVKVRLFRARGKLVDFYRRRLKERKARKPR